MGLQRPEKSYRVPWVEPRIQTVEEAILYTVSYADVFNYPLTVEEIHRYLVGMPASLAEVKAVTGGLVHTTGLLRQQDGFVMLEGREFLAGLRQRRAQVAAAMWPRALRYGRAIARLPFVRMVAVTGALTMDNVEAGDDYDYLIITAPGRLWVTRLLVIQLVVKPVARLGDEVCPNYLLAETALTIEEQDLFHAHELAQMIPLHGLEIYRQLRAENAWALRFLPNVTAPPVVKAVPAPNGSLGRRALELLLKSPAGTMLERQEMARMQRKLGGQAGFEEVVLSPERCKGHVGSHGHTTFDRFVARVDAFVSTSDKRLK
ncbi:MAG: hypothetical protein JXB35_05435 [Anaerolineae bacterium]|nr:hypothetical protein [Anaerolineae bacterium]